MSDPRNVAHAKKVTQEKKHHGTGVAEDTLTAQPGKKPASTKAKRLPAAAAPAPHLPPADASAAPSESPTPKPPPALDASMAVLAKLKEMEFYSRANLEQLATLALTVGDELKQTDVTGPLDEVYSAQNAFQTKLTTLLEAYKAECARLQVRTRRDPAHALAGFAGTAPSSQELTVQGAGTRLPALNSGGGVFRFFCSSFCLPSFPPLLPFKLPPS